jgi:hypothetical protein
MGLQNNAQNMLAQAKRQVKTDSIHELGPILNQVTASDYGPKVVLDNPGLHAVWGQIRHRS